MPSCIYANFWPGSRWIFQCRRQTSLTFIWFCKFIAVDFGFCHIHFWYCYIWRCLSIILKPYQLQLFCAAVHYEFWVKIYSRQLWLLSHAFLVLLHLGLPKYYPRVTSAATIQCYYALWLLSTNLQPSTLAFLSHALLVLLPLALSNHYPQAIPSANRFCYCALRPLRLIPTHYSRIYQILLPPSRELLSTSTLYDMYPDSLIHRVGEHTPSLKDMSLMLMSWA